MSTDSAALGPAFKEAYESTHSPTYEATYGSALATANKASYWPTFEATYWKAYPYSYRAAHIVANDASHGKTFSTADEETRDAPPDSNWRVKSTDGAAQLCPFSGLGLPSFSSVVSVHVHAGQI